MKKLLFLCLLCLWSCSTMNYTTYKSKFSPEGAALIESIPYQSSKIVMIFKYTPDVCFDSVYKRLLQNSYQVESENRNVGAITASMVAGDGAIRINSFCDNEKIAITGEYKPGTGSTNAASFILGVPMASGWNMAYWNHSPNSSTIDLPSAVFARILGVLRPLSKSDADIVFTKK